MTKDRRACSLGGVGQRSKKSCLNLGEGSPFAWVPEPDGDPVGQRGHWSEGIES